MNAQHTQGPLPLAQRAPITPDELLDILQNRSDLAVSVGWLLDQVPAPIHTGPDVVSDYAYRHALATRAYAKATGGQA